MRFSFLLFLSVLVGRSSFMGQPSRFAVIGDYGWTGQPEADVATMVRSWNPEFVITVGDNNYDNGAASTIDQNIGQYYHQYIFPYLGGYGQGDSVNHFFPALGNHDWVASGALPYLNYFALPGNERYYDFVTGGVHFFSVDSDPHEPDGTSSSSVQAQWLQNRLASSTARWKIVYFHHPPYTSGTVHGSTTYMQWPFLQWGASVVLSGHEHIYERLLINNVPYMINGLGGRSLYPIGTPIPGSMVRYNANYGAQLVMADDDSMMFSFYSRSGSLIDRYVIRATPTGVKDRGVKGENFRLDQNYPNPFNPSTRIGFRIQEAGFVSVKVLDLTGCEVVTLINEEKAAGEYEVTFSTKGRYVSAGDGRGLASGAYFYRLTADNFVQTKKLLLLK